MHQKVIEFNKAIRAKKAYPEFRPGDVVRISRKVKEGEKERIQTFEGLIIATRGGQSSSPTITVRKISYGVGVELIVPIYAPVVENIEIVKRAKVRRAKLFYIRGKSAKKARMKYKEVGEFIAEEEKEEEKPEKPQGETEVNKEIVTDKSAAENNADKKDEKVTDKK